MNALLLTIDGLHAGFLGPYGNTWLPTPGFNHLAAESFVFDHALVDTVDFDELCHSLWRGSHVRERGPGHVVPEFRGPPWMNYNRHHDLHTALVTDDARMARHSVAESFIERHWLAGEPPKVPAADISETRLAEFFATAAARLGTWPEPFLGWLHAGSLCKTWDAPLELRNRFVEEGELEPPCDVAVPCFRLPPDVDPDVVLGHRRVYAAQVSVLDACLAALREALRAKECQEPTLLIVAGLRGFNLGEHDSMGPPNHDDSLSHAVARSPLHEELIHVPLIVQVPGGWASVGRSAALVQTPDLGSTLGDWFEPGTPLPAAFGRSLLPLIRGDEVAWRTESLLTQSGGERAVRTAEWFLRQSPAVDAALDPRRELYAKPDDRWERNDVANRCPQVAEELAERLADQRS